MVAFNLPSKLSQMVDFNLPSKLSQMVAFNLASISSRTSKNPLKIQNPLSKEMDGMRNRMREMGVKECFELLANPRLPFPWVISPKKQKNKKQFFLLMRVGSGSVFFPLGASREKTLPGHSLSAPSKTRERIFSWGSALPKNAPLRSTIRERVRGGEGVLPHSLGLD